MQARGHIWADRYDREIDSIFAIRDEITRSIAGQLGGLQGKVAIAEVERSPRKIRIVSLPTITLRKAGTSGIKLHP